MAGADGQANIEKSLWQWAQVTNVISNTQFQSSRLAEFRDSYFVGWDVYVLRRADGVAAAPQGEQQTITAFLQTNGTVTHAAFTAALSVGDEIILLHPDVATILRTLGPGGTKQGLFYYGQVTAVPGANQFTIPDLAGYGDTSFVNWSTFVFWDSGGAGAAPQGEQQAITTYVSATGTFTTNAFTAPVAVGDRVIVLNPRLASSAGISPVAGAVVANWQAAEQDLVIIGANDTSNKLHSLVVGIQNLVGNITIRMYMQVNGVERRFYPVPAATTFTAAGDAPAIPVIDGTMGIHEAVRVTVQSDNAADNGAAVDYDYMLESM